MTLGEKQKMFVGMIAKLITWAHDNGYELTFGDAYRDPRVFGPLGIQLGYGQEFSCHKIRLAVDFNLFKNGEFLKTTEDHLPLGMYWESIGGSWGGRFNDGNHYSIEHEGKR
jgi:hypothetical protein